MSAYAALRRTSGSQVAALVRPGVSITAILLETHGWEGDEVRELAAELGYTIAAGSGLLVVELPEDSVEARAFHGLHPVAQDLLDQLREIADKLELHIAESR